MAKKTASNAARPHKKSVLLLILPVLFSLILTSCGKAADPDSTAASTTEMTTETTTEITTTSAPTTVEITTASGTAGSTKPAAPTTTSIFSDADQLYFKDCVFVGDSITTGIELYGVTKFATVLADTGLNTSTVMKYVSDIGRIKPKYIYVMLGSNDIGFANMTPDRLIANYDKFVKGIKDASPESLIYLQSVFPVTKKFEQVNESTRPAYNNENIDKYNERIRLMAADNNVLYLNVAEAVKDANNDLRQDIAPGEGMHIEKKGYYIWLEYVLSHRMTEG